MDIRYIVSVLSMTKLVDYQPGAVVSRILLKNTGAIITAFAFDVGQSMSEHTTPFDALVQVTEGEAVVTIGGAPHTLGSGDLVVLPAKVPHAVAATTRFKMLLIMTRGD